MSEMIIIRGHGLGSKIKCQPMFVDKVTCVARQRAHLKKI